MGSRGFITLIHIMASKFNIVITVFKTCRRLSISNIICYESPFEKLSARKNDIMITKLSENSSSKSKNEYYILINWKSFCGKKDAFDCAGIRAQVFRLPVDCSNQLSYAGVQYLLLHRKTSLYHQVDAYWTPV